MKSKIADLKNTGSKWGGVSTAAAFLGQFVGDTAWAHLDIAGMDIFTKATEYTAEGSTGFGVRLQVIRGVVACTQGRISYNSSPARPFSLRVCRRSPSK